MKRLLFSVVAVAAIGLAAPASAQFYAGAGPGGVGVQVGPVGAGVGPAWDGHHHWRGAYGAYGYAGDCRTMRERIVTPSGRVIFRTHRVCD
jgi:hypothetical protein